jgi:hypothetical protein
MVGPLSYIGGKNRLAKRIIEIFPKHTTYVEAFAGGAQVLFHKKPSAVEVLNDLDGEIVQHLHLGRLLLKQHLRPSRERFDIRRVFREDGDDPFREYPFASNVGQWSDHPVDQMNGPSCVWHFGQGPDRSV